MAGARRAARQRNTDKPSHGKQGERSRSEQTMTSRAEIVLFSRRHSGAAGDSPCDSSQRAPHSQYAQNTATRLVLIAPPHHIRNQPTHI